MFIVGYKNKFSSLLRAFSAAAIGLVMIMSNDATVTVVKIIAAFLCGTGVISLIYGYTNREKGAMGLMSFNAVIDVLLGVLLFMYPNQVGNFIVYIIGFLLLIFALLQIFVLRGALSFLGGGSGSIFLPLLALFGAILLLMNPFTMDIMSIIAGVFLLIYGVSEVLSLWKLYQVQRQDGVSFKDFFFQKPKQGRGFGHGFGQGFGQGFGGQRSGQGSDFGQDFGGQGRGFGQGANRVNSNKGVNSVNLAENDEFNADIDPDEVKEVDYTIED